MAEVWSEFSKVIFSAAQIIIIKIFFYFLIIVWISATKKEAAHANLLL
jgi:hypothetical protein